MAKKKEKLTNAEAFKLANVLQSEEITTIKDTEFALAVVRNFNMILEVYNELSEVQIPSEEWLELIKDKITEDEVENLREDNKELFEIREAQVAKYNELLEQPFPRNLYKIKLKNLNTKLSARDIVALDPMLNI